MTDKTADDAARGREAAMLMAHPLLKEVFATFETQCLGYWKDTTAPADTHARERIWQAVQVAAKVEDALGQIAANGRLAQSDLDRIAGKQP